MPVRRYAWLAFVSLSLLACDNTPNSPGGFVFVDASGPVDRPFLTDGSGLTDGGYQCSWPAALDNGGIPGCGTGRAFVTCTESSGSVSYPTTQAMGCPLCNGTCSEICALDEFALSCANPVSDAGASASSPSLPHGCHLAASFPTGSVAYCCPCQ